MGWGEAPSRQHDEELDRLHERIRTLEDALRSLVDEGDPRGLHKGVRGVCAVFRCGPAPCKYETARRALEGE